MANKKYKKESADKIKEILPKAEFFNKKLPILTKSNPF